MKNLKTLFYISVLLMSCIGAYGQSDSPDPSHWELVWNEEFSENIIDTTAWSRIPRNRADWGKKMSDVPEVFDLSNGILTLRAIVNTTHPEDTSKYITGGIWGLDKKYFVLGRIDIRAKITNAQGFWPAIWLLPQGINEPYSGGGEMDIMEHLNYDTFVYQTAHTQYTNLVNKTNPQNYSESPINMDEFNIYSVEVYHNKLVYLVNNKPMFEYPKLVPDEDKQFPFPLNSYYLVLSAQLGGNWVGDVDGSGLPAKMEIDYVRVYQPK